MAIKLNAGDEAGDTNTATDTATGPEAPTAPEGAAGADSVPATDAAAATTADAAAGEDVISGTAKVHHPDGATSCSHDGVTYEANKKGFFTVPLAALEHLFAHGFKLFTGD